MNYLDVATGALLIAGGALQWVVAIAVCGWLLSSKPPPPEEPPP